MQNNKYYIIKTKNKEFDFLNCSSLWTKKYKPLSIINIIKNCSQFDEEKIILEYMFEHGIHNVRGGTFSTIKINKKRRKYLKKKFRSSLKQCFNCGNPKHFKNKCPHNKCKRCKRKSHLIEKCKAKTFISGDIIPDNYQIDDERLWR